MWTRLTTKNAPAAGTGKKRARRSVGIKIMFCPNIFRGGGGGEEGGGVKGGGDILPYLVRWRRPPSSGRSDTAQNWYREREREHFC